MAHNEAERSNNSIHTKKNEKDKSDSTSCKSDSDSDFESTSAFFSANMKQKLPYTFTEDEEILSFVLKGRNIYQTSSISLWKRLEFKKRDPKRTYQSLKNRFLRNIKPNIFSTYKHLIKDESKVEMILEKFPELKKEMKKKFKLENLVLPKRDVIVPGLTRDIDLKNKNIQNKIETENTIHEDEVHLKFSINPQEKTVRSVEAIDDSIIITVKNYSIFTEKSSSLNLGIYEKYLKIKENNIITPCSYCGRGEPELNKPDELESRSDATKTKSSTLSEPCASKGIKKVSRNVSSSSDKNSDGSSDESCTPRLIIDIPNFEDSPQKNTVKKRKSLEKVKKGVNPQEELSSRNKEFVQINNGTTANNVETLSGDSDSSLVYLTLKSHKMPSSLGTSLSPKVTVKGFPENLRNNVTYPTTSSPLLKTPLLKNMVDMLQYYNK